MSNAIKWGQAGINIELTASNPYCSVRPWTLTIFEGIRGPAVQKVIEMTSSDVGSSGSSGGGVRSRPVRADARRNIDAVLKAAKEVFKTSGVDAPVRDIAARAGVGMGTLYRHFPQRADLIAAVFRKEVDACADAASTLAAKHGPADALGHWMQRYAAFIGTKRGLATALHSGDPTYATLPSYFEQKLIPTLQNLLDAAVDAGEARSGVDPFELLSAVGCLGMRADAESSGQLENMVALLVDGIRFGAKAAE